MLISLVHVVHVVIAGIVADTQPRIEHEQLLQRIFHRQDTAYHHSTLGVYHGIARKHLGKPLVHAPGYGLVLLGT